MKDADKKRFQYLIDDSKELQVEELRQLVQFTVSLHEENQDLKKKAVASSENNKGIYRHWCHGWRNLDGGETFLMVLGHIVTVIILAFSMSGVFAIVAGTTDSYMSSNQKVGDYYIKKCSSGGCSEDTNVKVMKEIPYGADTSVTPCTEFYVALEAMNSLRLYDKQSQIEDPEPVVTSSERPYRYNVEEGTCGSIN